MAQDVGRQSEGRTQGGGSSANIPNLSLFRKFTYTPAQLSSGVKTEKPYYCYNAEIMILKGLCDSGPIARALEKEGLFPVCAPNGKAPVSIWINDLKDTVIGPYREIVFAFDAWTRPNTVARFRTGDPYGLLYSFFGGQCITYLHTLYISSPLSIMWGREMQAFPKHPEPTRIEADFGRRSIRFDTHWEGKPLLQGLVGRRWGPLAFLRQAYSLVDNFGVAAVAGFLSSPVVTLDVAMPLAVKKAYGIECSHKGHILKGRNPLGVRTWPWNAGDHLQLGTGRQADAADGQESPTDLLQEANFKPAIVMHIPCLQMVVTDC